MKGSFIRRTAVAAALALVIAQHPMPAGAWHPGSTHLAAACATPASTDCIQSFTVNGGAAPAGVELEAYFDGTTGTLSFQLRNNNNPDSYELAPALTEASEVIVVAQLSAAFLPKVVIGSGYIGDWIWDAGTYTITIVAYPRATSWTQDPAGCLPGACPSSADVDYTAMLIMSVEDGTVTVPGAPPEAIAEIETFVAKFKGGIIATNAQYFGVPRYESSTMSLEFDLGAPHLRDNGSVNQGYFKVLVPDPVFTDLWGISPGDFSVTTCGGGGGSGGLAVQMDGSPITVAMTRWTARTGLPDGWSFENCAWFDFSTPVVSIKPASAASIPVDSSPPPPPRLPDVASTDPASYDVTVRMPDSGAIRAPVTLTGGNASVALQQGTALITSTNKTFNGYIRPPKAVADPTGGKLLGTTSFSVYGGPDLNTEVRLSLPATLTIPLPAGYDPKEYQPVSVGTGNALTYLIGRTGGQGVALDVDRLSERGTTIGLAKIPKPAVQSATPAIVREPGYHSRWAGQSDPVDLAPGQLTDVTVLLRNTGDRMWTRGDLATQVNLGAPNSLAHGLGILVSPLWGTDRFATTAEQYVPVGDVGTFRMRLRAPAIAGVFRVYLRPVIDGVSWLEDEGIYLELRVK